MCLPRKLSVEIWYEEVPWLHESYWESVHFNKLDINFSFIIFKYRSPVIEHSVFAQDPSKNKGHKIMDEVKPHVMDVATPEYRHVCVHIRQLWVLTALCNGKRFSSDHKTLRSHCASFESFVKTHHANTSRSAVWFIKG